MNFWYAQIRNSLNWTQWLPELGLQGLAPHGNSVGMWKKIQISDSLCNCNAKLQKIILVKTTASRNAGTYMYIILELCIYSIRFYFILFYSTLTGLWWHTPDGSLQNPEACENILGCGSDGSDGKSNPTQLALAGGSWLWKCKFVIQCNMLICLAILCSDMSICVISARRRERERGSDILYERWAHRNWIWQGMWAAQMACWQSKMVRCLMPDARQRPTGTVSFISGPAPRTTSQSVHFGEIFVYFSHNVPDSEIPRLREAKAFSVFSVFDVSLKVKTEDAHTAKHAYLKRLVT